MWLKICGSHLAYKDPNKCLNVNILQSRVDVTQNRGAILYYKVRQMVLQSKTGITK